MRVGVEGFVPGRLTEARNARRVPTKSALARLISISPSTVSRWEEGSSSPEAEVLEKLASLLNVRPQHFLRPRNEGVGPVFFRSLSDALSRDIDYQTAHMRWLQEISAIIQHYTDFKPVDLPLALKGSTYRQLRNEDIEDIALELRRHWKIGDGPCANVVALMERVGFVVSSIEMGTARLDGLCNWSQDGRPHVLLATDKMSFARRQMDAAHEMAHAVLHRDVTEGELIQDWKLIEAQAFRLASAFLMPSTSYPAEIRSISLTNLVSLKDRWKVSIKAQIKRLQDLKMVDGDFSTHLYKLYSAKGWSKEEPFDRQWPIQEPRVLSDALKLIVEGGVRSKEDLLAVEFTMSAGDIENICGLPPGWFARDPAEIVKLKPAANRPDGNAQSGPSAILQFPTPTQRNR